MADRLDGSLNARLARYRDDSRLLRPDFARAYDRLVEHLASLERGEVGPQIGERMPEFHLPDQNGKLISLASLLQSGPAVISINRGHWCPYCKLEIRALAAACDDIARLGGRIVSIMPDRAQFTDSYIASNAVPFPVLSDIDLGYALSLGLVFWVGDEVLQLYREVGLDLEKFQGNPANFLPLAAKFVVGQDGIVKAKYVDVEFRKRMEPTDLLTVLRDLAGQGDPKGQ